MSILFLSWFEHYDDDDDDDKNQQITIYDLLKADILLILYKGVSIYYKISLPSKMKKYYLQKWVNFEIKINKTNFILIFSTRVGSKIS